MLLAGGGGAGYAGVTLESGIPLLLNVGGSLRVGADQANGDYPALLYSYAKGEFVDTLAHMNDADPLLNVVQTLAPIVGGQAVEAFYILRGGDISAVDYSAPSVTIDDISNSAQPLIRVKKGGVSQFQVDSDGVQVHGKFKVGDSVTHTLGAYTGVAKPIYDESGTLLGYMPLYA